ncbi:MAG: transglycosylase domain-containing protein [Actinomycetota bacterium]|nr:transglycosylase domain-containing protein [Actinomycetota bacterium]
MARMAVLLVALVGAGVLLGLSGVAGWVVSVADSAPDINQLKPRDPGQLSEVYASDGSLLGYISSDVLRSTAGGGQIPQALKNATIAIEDRRFYQHGGVDYQGIVRAGVRDVFGGGRSVQGGSTLTMQLVDNVYLPYQIREHHNLKYKIIQAKLAQELEQKRPKSWILTQYLNDVAYGTLGGQTAVGVAAASQLFFDEPVNRLNLAQTALLAGLPQAPSEYNPFLDPTRARNRRHQVLQAMVQSHYISPDQAAAADASPLQIRRNNTFNVKRQPYVFDYVKDSLIKRYGLKTVLRGGLKVYTTIDLKRQREARQALLSNEGQPGDPAAALVSIDPHNGHILAMATTSSYDQTNFNYATQSHRQTGSAFKVFTLMTLIHDFQGDPNQTNYTSRELLPGWLPNYPTYHVQTAEQSYQGTISIAKATTISDNTVFAQLAQDVGIDKVTATAHAMGITSPLSGFPSEALGAVAVSPLEMADAYATLASGGVHHDPTAISRVVFPDHSVAHLGTASSRRAFTDGEAYAATQVLKTVIQSGTGTAAGYGCPAAGKTGTTTSFTDAYFAGYTPQLTTAVWVGYPNSTISMNDVNGLGQGFGGTLAAPIWHDYMSRASGGYCGDFPQPSTPFSGTSFAGRFSSGGGSSGSGSSVSGSGSGSGTGTGTGTGTGYSSGASTGTSSSPYNNSSLYAHPPQSTPGGGGSSGGGGNGSGNRSNPPAGAGGGQTPSSGGAGVKHP